MIYLLGRKTNPKLKATALHQNQLFLTKYSLFTRKKRKLILGNHLFCKSTKTVSISSSKALSRLSSHQNVTTATYVKDLKLLSLVIH